MARPKTATANKSRSAILEGLNESQRKAVVHGEGPLLIVAGAGTGKTTVITRRIAYLIEQGVKPEQILALAFGEKASAEMEERVDRLLPLGYRDLQISTFHAFAELILRDYGVELGIPDFQVLDEVGQWLLVRNNLEKFDLDYYRPLGNPTRFIRALTQHFSKAKDELVEPQEYLEHAEKLRISKDQSEAGLEDFELESKRVTEVANAFHVYQRLLLQNNFLDFGDLVNYTMRLFQKRPQVLQHYRQRFKYILLDEFQDTNFAQYEFIKLLAHPLNNLTVVGDDDQSIYKFRGASISNILHFQKDYPTAVFLSLTQNYRSGQTILDQAHRFIRQNDPDRLEVRLKVDKHLQNPGNSGGKLVVLSSPDFVSEARLVAEKIVSLKAAEAAATWDDFAILARSHDTLEPFIAVLEENQIPHIYFANKGLYKKPVILDIVAYFRLLEDYHDSQALYRVANFPVFKISHRAIVELSHSASKKSLSLHQAFQKASDVPGVDSLSLEGIKKLLQLLEKHLQSAKTRSAEQVYIEAVNDLDFARAALADYQVGKYLENFRRRIQDFQARATDRSAANFIKELNFEQEAGGAGQLEVDTEAGPEAVKLMTLHGAKGLEFGTVFLVGLADKRFPTVERKDPIELPKALIKDILPQGDAHLEEERRLFYVGMTRAKQNLFFTWAQDYGGKLKKKPSRFLQELGLVAAEVAKPTGKVVFREARAAERIDLPVPDTFSFSQISTFRKCPLQYKFQYVLRLPVPGKATLSFGQTIHAAFEKFLRLHKQAGQSQDLFGASSAAKLPDLAALKKFYEESWVDDWYDSQAQKQDYRQKGERILKLFYDELAADPPRSKYLEEKFRLRFDKYWISGKIDRADDTPTGLLVVDYKTGPPRGIYKVDRQQLLLYQWAAQDILREHVADLQYWFLWDTLTKESFLGKPADLEKLQTEFLETVKDIIGAVKADSFYDLDLHVSHECEYRDLTS